MFKVLLEYMLDDMMYHKQAKNYFIVDRNFWALPSKLNVIHFQ